MNENDWKALNARHCAAKKLHDNIVDTERLIRSLAKRTRNNAEVVIHAYQANTRDCYGCRVKLTGDQVRKAVLPVLREGLKGLKEEFAGLS